MLVDFRRLADSDVLDLPLQTVERSYYSTLDLVSHSVAAIMAAVHALPASPPTYAMSDEIKHDYHHNPAPLQAHTPPTTDEASHKDDDAASSSSLSDLDESADLDVKMEDFDDQLNRQRFEDAARAGAEAEKHSQIKPHHYEGGVPIFQPTMDEFRGR